MTIVEFLEARIAEDELTAHAAIERSPQWHAFYDYRDVKDGEGHVIVEADSRYPTIEQAAHIARHSPARVLRESEMKRAIIADYLRRDATGDLIGRGVLETVLRSLAAIYADHAAYDQSWA
jgi:hypothetical protein